MSTVETGPGVEQFLEEDGLSQDWTEALWSHPSTLDRFARGLEGVVIQPLPNFCSTGRGDGSTLTVHGIRKTPHEAEIFQNFAVLSTDSVHAYTHVKPRVYKETKTMAKEVTEVMGIIDGEEMYRKEIGARSLFSKSRIKRAERKAAKHLVGLMTAEEA